MKLYFTHKSYLSFTNRAKFLQDLNVGFERIPLTKLVSKMKFHAKKSTKLNKIEFKYKPVSDHHDKTKNRLGTVDDSLKMSFKIPIIEDLTHSPIILLISSIEDSKIQHVQQSDHFKPTVFHTPTLFNDVPCLPELQTERSTISPISSDDELENDDCEVHHSVISDEEESSLILEENASKDVSTINRLKKVISTVKKSSLKFKTENKPLKSVVSR